MFTNGKDKFKNNIFSSFLWSAPALTSVEEIKSRIASFNLVGRKIKEIRMIGHSYILTRDWIEEAAYNDLPDNMPEDERHLKSDYDNIRPDLELSRHSEIDEPLLIGFEDGDIFEIDSPMETEYRFSMNCIPWYIKYGTNEPNVDANVLFEPCIGKKIVEVAVDNDILSIEPIISSPFEYETNPETVSRIVLWLEGGIGLCISGWFDYCEVVCIDRNNKALSITFEDLKPALFNREDVDK